MTTLHEIVVSVLVFIVWCHPSPRLHSPFQLTSHPSPTLQIASPASPHQTDNNAASFRGSFVILVIRRPPFPMRPENAYPSALPSILKPRRHSYYVIYSPCQFMPHPSLYTEPPRPVSSPLSEPLHFRIDYISSALHLKPLDSGHSDTHSGASDTTN